MTDLLAQRSARDHLVQFYGDSRELVPSVATYLKEGAARGDWMIVIATPSHRDQFKEALRSDGVAVDSLETSGRLTVLDAETTLSRLLVGGSPVRERFEEVVGQLVRATKARAGESGLRAYGEMVNLLWTSGRLEAATKLEEFWNNLLEASRFSLFCAYTVDPLSGLSPAEPLRQILHVHSHLLPERSNGELTRSVERAMVEVIGEKSTAALLPLIRASRHSVAALAPAESTILWLRHHLPVLEEAVLTRTRRFYEEECARSAGREDSK
ncbi:MAG: MEDS domain-containing protein [Planctomycetaceae bacterium]|nr:MEDS domain-containing protein [Planctomycetaceae bacterium]